MVLYKDSRAKLLEERDEARQDGRLNREVPLIQIKPANSGRGRDPVEPGGLGADGTAPQPRSATAPPLSGLTLGAVGHGLRRARSGRAEG